MESCCKEKFVYVIYFLTFTGNIFLVHHDVEAMDESGKSAKDEISSKFKNFVKHYNRSYIYDPVEYQYRMNVFLESTKRINLLNKKEKEFNGTAVYGINKFSDWTREEFIAHLSKFHKNSTLSVDDESCCEISPSSSLLKLSWDWRKKHKVTSVKNQGNCGSCWAFAATGVVETQWAIAKDLSTPVELSVQELVSCSRNAGCEGGSISGTLNWLANCRVRSQEKCFLLPASEYPYEEKESKCAYSEIEPKTGAQIQCACSRNFKGEETQLANYIFLNGSVGVGVNAVLWHDYVGGIIQHHCTDTVIDHAVIIEGYDSSGYDVKRSPRLILLKLGQFNGGVPIETSQMDCWTVVLRRTVRNLESNGPMVQQAIRSLQPCPSDIDVAGKVPYWIVRNSWGSDFGDNGYLYIKMNGNICGIAERVSFARV